MQIRFNFFNGHWRGDNPSVWIAMGTKSELLKENVKKSLIWRNAVILGSQQKFSRGVWIVVSELLQVSELSVSITKKKETLSQN